MSGANNTVGASATTADTYAISARHYDAAYAAKSDLVDAPFYFDLARESGGPVLEIGCGTGRVLLPIARAGIQIHGLDQSAAMLAVLKEKIAREPIETRRLITLHQGDMRRARLPHEFPLVIMPFRPFQHMHTQEDQIAALRTASIHLTGNGRFAFDVFYPKFDSLLSGIGEERFEMEWPIEGKSGQIIRRYYRKDAIDKIHQEFLGTFIYRAFDGDRVIHEETAPLRMTWYLYPELRALFRLAQLEPVAEFGSFAKAPLDNSSNEMIFILRRAPQSHP
jgi:SAM-dependent methyltransferase